MAIELTVRRTNSDEATETAAACVREKCPLVVFDLGPGREAAAVFGLTAVPKELVDSVLVLDLADTERALSAAAVQPETRDADLAFLRYLLRVWYRGDDEAVLPVPAAKAEATPSAARVLDELCHGDADKTHVLERGALLEWRAELRRLGPDMRGPLEDPWFRRLAMDGDCGTLAALGRLFVFVPLFLPATPFDVAARVIQIVAARVLQARTVLPTGGVEGGGPVTVLVHAPAGRHDALVDRLRRGCAAPCIASPAIPVSATLVHSAGVFEVTPLSSAIAKLSRLRYGRDRTIVADEMDDLPSGRKFRPLLADDPVKGLMYRHLASCGPLDQATGAALDAARLALGVRLPPLELPDEL